LIRIELPRFAGNDAAEALSAILRHRLSLHDTAIHPTDAFDPDALRALARFYEETGGLRHTLAAAQSAADHAAENAADAIGIGHVRASINEWRSR